MPAERRRGGYGICLKRCDVSTCAVGALVSRDDENPLRPSVACQYAFSACLR